MYWIEENILPYLTGLLAVYILGVFGIASFLATVSLFTARANLHKKTVAALPKVLPGISVIKPLMGVDPLLEINLESYFTLTYPKFELLFGFHDDHDPTIAVVNKLMKKYPHVDVRLFIGGADDSINPMVQNMAPQYDAAKYPYVWISSSRILASDDIVWDFVYKLQCSDVGLVHQLPFTTDHVGFADTLEKIYFGCSIARNYLAINTLRMHCVVGMSYIFKKALLDEEHGLAWYGKYLAEDFFLTKALFKKGYRLVVSAIPAKQNCASSVKSQKDRLIRWLRLRFSMMPCVSIGLETFSEAIPLGLFAAWGAWHLFQINPYIAFMVHLCIWHIRDYAILLYVQNGPLPFSIVHYFAAAIFRDLFLIVVNLEAWWRPRMIKWGTKTYRVNHGGHTTVVNDSADTHFRGILSI